MNTACRCGARPLFELGSVLISPEAHARLLKEGVQLIEVLWLHVTGQWGIKDHAANQTAVRSGTLVLSVFASDDGDVVVATDAARTTTVVDLKDSFRPE